MRALAAALAALAFPFSAQSQAVLSPPSDFVPWLEEARQAGPEHPAWVYVAGLINGANVHSLLAYGTPVVCNTPGGNDIDQTLDTIMNYVAEYKLAGDPNALFEIVVVVSHAIAFPCSEGWGDKI